MKTKKVPRPTIGRVVHVGITDSMVCPAGVFAVHEHNSDTISLEVEIWGPPIITEIAGNILYSKATKSAMVKGFGEVSPGVPAPGCWCWPAMSRDEIEVPDRLAGDAVTVPGDTIADRGPTLS